MLRSAVVLCSESLQLLDFPPCAPCCLDFSCFLCCSFRSQHSLSPDLSHRLYTVCAATSLCATVTTWLPPRTVASSAARGEGGIGRKQSCFPFPVFPFPKHLRLESVVEQRSIRAYREKNIGLVSLFHSLRSGDLVLFLVCYKTR